MDTDRTADMLKLLEDIEDFNISSKESPAKTKPSVLPEGVKKTVIPKNELSYYLRAIWIACYMLYDYNIRHAEDVFGKNDYEWQLQTWKQVENDSLIADNSRLEKTLTDTYNQILLADVKDFLDTHAKVWNCDHQYVKKRVAEVVKEYFGKQKKGGLIYVISRFLAYFNEHCILSGTRRRGQ